MIITIDGPAGSGKSTVAKRIADKLDYVYFDTGAMYRSFTWYLIKNNVDINDKEKVISQIDSFKFFIKTNHQREKSYFVNDVDVTKDIRTKTITKYVSQVSSYVEVRKELVKLQRAFAEENDAVFEGRDMGTVVFPKADVKIFLVADEEERARRRLKEFNEKFPDEKTSCHFEDVLEDIKRRDDFDSNRKISPLKQAEDAILVDTTNLSIDQVVLKILQIVKKKRGKIRTTPYFSKMKWVYRIVLFFAWLIMKVFYRHKVYGIDNYFKGPALIASNHVSFYDPPAVAVSCPEEIHFLARESLFKHKFFGKFISKINSHPISGKMSDLKVFRLIKKLLKEDKKILLFPEGTRSEDNKIKKLLPGIGFLSHLSQCKILPVYIHGAYNVWGRKRKFPKLFGKIICIFGKSIDPKEFKRKNKDEEIQLIMKELEKRFLELKKWAEENF